MASWPLIKPKSLGAKLPESKPYVSKYRMTPATYPYAPTPGVLGTNWYSNFDDPQFDGLRWWIGKGDLGYVRGGHAICMLPGDYKDMWRWWYHYDQGFEGACVGFSWSRAMSLINRTRYDGRWLYKEAQLVDPWSDTPPEEGTSVDAGAQILFKRGHKALDQYTNVVKPENLLEGIAAYRWATSVDDVHAALHNDTADKLGAVPLLNSWGTSYPRKVWLPDDVLDRLLQEDGEVAFFTDR